MTEPWILDEEQARRELVKWGKEIYARGLVNGTGGNLSIRISPHTVLCTPSGWSLGHLSAESITRTNLEGAWEGIKPTKELPMHLAVYEARPDISAIVHTHSIYAVTYACTMQPGEWMPAYIPSLVAKVGRVKLTPFQMPASKELGETVSEGIQGSQGVLMENHGVLTVGKTLEEAISAAFEVEDNARIHFISQGVARPLPEWGLANIKAAYK